MKKVCCDKLKSVETNILLNSSISKLLTCKAIDIINCQNANSSSCKFIDILNQLYIYIFEDLK